MVDYFSQIGNFLEEERKNNSVRLQSLLRQSYKLWSLTIQFKAPLHRPKNIEQIKMDYITFKQPPVVCRLGILNNELSRS